MIYIVYSYKLNSYHPTKYIVGVYDTLENAKQRQIVICGENLSAYINGSVTGNGNVSFINIFEVGDCDKEIFT